VLAGSAGFPPVEVALSRPTSECGTDLPPTTSTAAAGMAVAVPLHALALSTDTTTASTTAAAAVASAAIASFAAAALASALATTVMATTVMWRREAATARVTVWEALPANVATCS
jgi:hypothetical protein